MPTADAPVPDPSSPPPSEAGAIERPTQPHRVASHASDTAAAAMRTLSRFDIAAGWPPKLAGMHERQNITPARWQSTFGPHEQQQYVAIARQNPDVQRLLRGRSELLGCHVTNHKHQAAAKHHVRVCFANYSDVHLVDVHMHDQRVVSVVKAPNHAHPEAPIEMAQAIAIARRDARIQAHVEGLLPNAILQVPHPRSPHRDNRCLLVTFTEAADAHLEREALYSAIVDLNLQQVITAGKCTCAAEGHHE